MPLALSRFSQTSVRHNTPLSINLYGFPLTTPHPLSFPFPSSVTLYMLRYQPAAPSIYLFHRCTLPSLYLHFFPFSPVTLLSLLPLLHFSLFSSSHTSLSSPLFRFFSLLASYTSFPPPTHTNISPLSPHTSLFP